jgi:paraquat-inducible protein B
MTESNWFYVRNIWDRTLAQTRERRRMKRILLAWLVMGLLAVWLGPGQASATGRRVALVIGSGVGLEICPTSLKETTQ